MSGIYGPSAFVPFHDKAWRRADMAAWDARWARLSPEARRFVLDGLQTGPYHGGDRPVQPPSAAPGPVLAELLREDFLVRHLDGYVVAEDAVGFVNRVRSVRRFDLLGEGAPYFDRYVNQVFATFDLGNVLAGIVERRTGSGARGNDLYDSFVLRHFWPDWVAAHLNAVPLIDAIDKAGVVPLDRLAALVPEMHPSAVRTAYDALVNHLALFEGLDADANLVTGLLASVRTERRKRRAARAAAMTGVEAVDAAPESGFEVPDLRSVLMEVAASQPRLKQDATLYAKEMERFLAALDPLPAWLLSGGEQASREHRLTHALRWATKKHYVKRGKATPQTTTLELTDAGREWLSLGREAQYDALFAELRGGALSGMYDNDADHAFLGSTYLVNPQRSHASREYAKPRLGDVKPLREALHQLFGEMKLNEFYPVEAFFAWGADPARNPLLLGTTPKDVAVICDGRPVARHDEALEEAGQKLLRSLVFFRLAGLGCVQIARDAQNRTLLARLPRLDAYFGKPRQVPVEESVTRVIVQPDFTVMVIGIDPGPAAALAPFCDRQLGSANQGASTFRISRESIFRGIAGGTKADEIPARLVKLATNAVPANVLTEVTAWSGMAKTVRVEMALVIRCPDEATASRVAAALGKQAERLGETAVAFKGKLTPALRQKLQGQGVMVGGA